MRDIKRKLQTDYFSLLTGIVIDGYTVPVYDDVPQDATYPYIKLGEWTEVDFSDKTSFGGDVTLTVQIVDRFQGTVSRAKMYDVVDEVKKIIRARPVPFNVVGWNILTSVVDNETTFRQLTDTFVYVYSNIRFRHLAEQLFVDTFDETFDNTFA